MVRTSVSIFQYKSHQTSYWAGLSLALVHSSTNMLKCVDKWIMETTCPHKHVQILDDQIFIGLTLLAIIISQLDKYPKMFHI